MISLKKIKEDAKTIAEIRSIKKKLEKAKDNPEIWAINEKLDDMQIMIHNFGIALEALHETQLELFKLANSDKIKVGNDKIYKDVEQEKYIEIKDWYAGVLERWK